MKKITSAQKFESKDWIFQLKSINHGKIVQKYNIISAIVENYFVASTQLRGFEIARSKQDLDAYKKFGKLIKY